MKTIIRGWEIFVENSVCWNNSRVIIFLQGVRGERADSQRHKEADGREKGTIAATFVNDKNKMSHEHSWLLCPCPAPAALPSLSQWGYSPKFTKSIRYNKKRNELKQLNFNTSILIFLCVYKWYVNVFMFVRKFSKNSWPGSSRHTHLYFSSAKTTGMCHQVWLCTWILGIKLRSPYLHDSKLFTLWVIP